MDPNRLFFDVDPAAPGGRVARWEPILNGGICASTSTTRDPFRFDTKHLMILTDGSMAAGSRFDEEGDWLVRQFISPSDLQSKPEEYVARHAHAPGAFSFHFYRFHDLGLGAWVRRVGELLAPEEEVKRCRERFLSPVDMAIAQRQDAEEL